MPVANQKIIDDLIAEFGSGKILLNQQALRSIIERIVMLQRKCNVLVFGLGHDSRLFHAANCNGRTLFVEGNEKWIQKANSAFEVLRYNYMTSVGTTASFIDQSLISKYPVPSELLDSHWDVILIDSPEGWADHTPGRSLPILWTKEIISPHTHVYIDDTNRPLENRYIRALLSPLATKMNRFSGRPQVTHFPGFRATQESIVVYSCVAGQSDFPESTLGSIEPSTEGNIKYVLFTDDMSISMPPQWEVRCMVVNTGNARRDARLHKIAPHRVLENHDLSVWIDGAFSFKESQLYENFIAPNRESPIAVFKHPKRITVASEVKVCTRLGLGNAQVMREQLNRYRQEGFADDCGLFATGVLLRENTPAIRTFNDFWWQEVEYGSVRDQISFPYALWKQDMNVKTLPGNIFNSKWFRQHAHTHTTKNT